MSTNRFIPVCEPMLAGNEQKYVMDAISTGWISSAGAYVKKFEEAFSSYCDMEYGVAVSNGTVALHLALRALGIGAGDEVIIPAFTMIASAFAVCYTGAMPVFIDADPHTWNIDVARIEEKITTRTRAIMPVHIYGNPCDMDEIVRLARKYNLYIVEDAAEAHGAEYKGRKTGSFSDISAFSFFSNKNITTGEGGMALTNSEALYYKCQYFKNVCFPPMGPRNYIHEDIGYNYRMTNLHAAIGLAQVEKADDYRRLRIKNAELYKRWLESCPGITFQEDTPDSLCVHWMNTVIIDSEAYGHTRDELIAYLKAQGIDTRLLFVGMARQPSLQKYGCDCSGRYPVTDWLTENGFYLPSSSSLTEKEIEYICAKIIDFAGKGE